MVGNIAVQRYQLASPPLLVVGYYIEGVENEKNVVSSAIGYSSCCVGRGERSTCASDADFSSGNEHEG